ncbi:sensor domain-containing diguanylate cyclase [Propionivibrio dicarboxylicus]|uniref:diguanylate cyclase n=1 Tax=Propionivibrio dicarboxylicus TaxID=83767 RepID=A0A1G8JIY7_9RHOO|nr:sensor domain-containing diguanylate cyclase [Propionivibrio dicarboxylicus]SDI31116.1 diguanylate cyclase (GGDEF) domain-containing protein [Propionivibrio dicarboxylicus]
MNNSRFLKRVIAMTVLVNLLAITIGVVSLVNSRQHGKERAMLVVSGYAGVVAQALSGVVDRIDLALSTCVSEMEVIVSKPRNESNINDFVERQLKLLPELSAIRIVDTQGRIIHGVGPALGTVTSVADREYFIRAKQAPQSGLIVSKPLIAKTTGEISIFLVKPIRKPDGAFAGIVYTAITLKQIRELFQTPYLGHNGVVTLIDQDGDVLARHPESARSESSFKRAGLPEEFNEALRKNSSAGTVSLRSPIDGIPRVVAYRKTAPFSGYVLVGVVENDYFSDWHDKLLTTLSLLGLFVVVTCIASALLYSSWKAKSLLAEQLDHQARTDALTGCANRRHFLELLQAEHLRTIRYQRAFCLVSLDLDYFKSINDRYGHLVGDKALCHFASVVRKTIRPSDHLGRVGGEEFAIILPETTLASATAIAERIRKEVELAPISLGDSLLTMTVSIGVAEWTPPDANNVEKLVVRADTALYKAKSDGRNNVKACDSPN